MFNFYADSRAYHSWLTYPGSLTARLRAYSQTFSTLCIRQGMLRPNLDECALLGLRHTDRAWVREVILYCDNIPVIFAHSILPRANTRGIWRFFTRIGNSPLGDQLFSNPRIRRGSMQFCHLQTPHPLLRQAHKAIPTLTATSLWARRSLFYAQNKPLLVTEVFLPQLLTLS